MEFLPTLNLNLDFPWPYLQRQLVRELQNQRADHIQEQEHCQLMRRITRPWKLDESAKVFAKERAEQECPKQLLQEVRAGVRCEVCKKRIKSCAAHAEASTREAERCTGVVLKTLEDTMKQLVEESALDPDTIPGQRRFLRDSSFVLPGVGSEFQGDVAKKPYAICRTPLVKEARLSASLICPSMSVMPRCWLSMDLQLDA